MMETRTPSRADSALGTRSRSGWPSWKSKYISKLASITSRETTAPHAAPLSHVQVDDSEAQRHDFHVRETALLQHAPERLRRREAADRLWQVVVGARVPGHDLADGWKHAVRVPEVDPPYRRQPRQAKLGG